MSTFDASASTAGFNMFSLTTVNWSSLGSNLASNYSYFTDDGHDVDLFDTVAGSFTYDGSDNPTGGTVTNGQIDLNDDDFLAPDVVFSGSFDLVTMTDGGTSGNTSGFYNEILGSHDVVTGSGFNDSLKGLGGDDAIDGGLGDDSLVGGTRDDTLSGGDGIDILEGGAGDDYLLGGFGFDTLNGGSGIDTADWSHTPIGYTIDLAAQTASQSGSPESISGIENVIGTTGGDTVTGSSGDNLIKGIGGDDIVVSGAGNDLVDGGDGSDLMAGGLDNDTISGGKGFDLIHGDEGNDVLRGNQVGDTLKGLGGDDLLVGGGGIDSLDGGDGNDVMRGNQGVDELHGGADNDVMAGRGGSDSLSGGAGDDLLTGKAGADNYFFEQFGTQTDTIRSFTPGVGGDVITLVGFGATFDDFSEVMAAATDDGFSTTINFGGGDILVIRGVVVADFDPSDFAFI